MSVRLLHFLAVGRREWQSGDIRGGSPGPDELPPRVGPKRDGDLVRNGLRDDMGLPDSPSRQQRGVAHSVGRLKQNRIRQIRWKGLKRLVRITCCTDARMRQVSLSTRVSAGSRA